LCAGAFHCLERRSFRVGATFCCFAWSCEFFLALWVRLLRAYSCWRALVLRPILGAWFQLGQSLVVAQLSSSRPCVGWRWHSCCRSWLLGGSLASSWSLSLGRGGLVPRRSTPRLGLGYPVLQWQLASLLLAGGARLGAASFVCGILMAAWRRVRLWMSQAAHAPNALCVFLVAPPPDSCAWCSWSYCRPSWLGLIVHVSFAWSAAWEEGGLEVVRLVRFACELFLAALLVQKFVGSLPPYHMYSLGSLYICAWWKFRPL
jgi:hypothetical protein